MLSTLGVAACDDASRFSAGDALGACTTTTGQCLDNCPSYPRILSCPSLQVCDFRDGLCRAPAADVLLGTAARCGRLNCLGGTQCSLAGGCLMKPYAFQQICDVVGNCWGTVGRFIVNTAPPPALRVTGLPDGEALDIFAKYEPSRGNLVQVLFRGTNELILVTFDAQGQEQRRIPVEGFVEDAAIDAGKLVWIAGDDDGGLLRLDEYRLSGVLGTSRNLVSATPRLFGRQFPGTGRGYCVTAATSRVYCDMQLLELGDGAPPFEAAEVFARRPLPRVGRGNTDVLLYGEVSALLLARDTRLTLVIAGGFGPNTQESAWANLPAPAFSIVRHITGMVYVSLTDGQVLELSSGGEILRVVMNHPGRHGRITTSPDGYLYFAAAGDIEGMPPILDHVRLPNGYF